ncbi:MAG: 23S rRNA (cytosine(1962)-C(5))-methyltransferase RlmI [Candidatus Zixiibacteriota bacterium]
MSRHQATIVTLKSGKEKPGRIRHPWVFSGAIQRVHGNPQAGDIVEVRESDNRFVAYGYYNPKSQIVVRLLSWDQSEIITEEWWIRRLSESLGRRRSLIDSGVTNAVRLVHAEADRLPGLIVDTFDNLLVLQAQTAGIDRVKPLIIKHLQDTLAPSSILERTDPQARSLEGLPPARGPLEGPNPPMTVTIEEYGRKFLVDVLRGQKTGFYLDQRENRRIVADYAGDREVLDCFAYTGGFTVHAMGKGARAITCIESSAPSMQLLRQNVDLNCRSQSPIELICDNAFERLRKFRDGGRQFDLVILDPPKLAPTRAHVDKALRSYKDLNLLAMKVLRPDGILATFSCSSAVNPGRFQNAVAWAALDAGRDVQVIQRLGQPSDHPVLLSFPESEYLKGLICRVV